MVVAVDCGADAPSLFPPREGKREGAAVLVEAAPELAAVLLPPNPLSPLSPPNPEEKLGPEVVVGAAPAPVVAGADPVIAEDAGVDAAGF